MSVARVWVNWRLCMVIFNADLAASEIFIRAGGSLVLVYAMLSVKLTVMNGSLIAGSTLMIPAGRGTLHVADWCRRAVNLRQT